MVAQRRNVFTASRREIYLTGCWTTYRFQLALEARRLESIFKVVHYRGVEGMRRAGNNVSPPRWDVSQAVIPRLPYPKFGRCIASRDSICRSSDQGREAGSGTAVMTDPAPPIAAMSRFTPSTAGAPKTNVLLRCSAVYWAGVSAKNVSNNCILHKS